MKKIISLVLVAMMLVASMAMAVAADTSVNVAELPDASDFSDAQYTHKILHIGANGDIKSMGTWNLAGVSKIVISYGTDPSVASIAENNVYVKDAAGNVIGQAKLSQPGLFWALGQREVEIAINSDYNGELFITKDDAANQMAIDAITLVGGSNEGGATAPETPSNPETSDFAVVVVALATLSLAGIVVCKKARA